MKLVHTIIIAFTAATLLTACNGDEIDRLEQQNQALRQAQASQDSMLNNYLSAFNTFEENLEAIKAREDLISSDASDPELQGNAKDKILDDIAQINDLLDQNRQIIDDLNSRLERAESEQPQLRRLIASLETQLQEKDATIASLKEELQTMNFTAESLNRRLDTMRQAREQLAYLTANQEMRISAQDSTMSEMETLIEMQENELNTGYYVIGSSRDLKDQDIITTEGGFIGIGGTKVLDPNFDHEAFTRINITETEEIPFNNRKVELVTSHPSDAYILNESDNRITSLQITDPERFWSKSRYLVVMTN